MRVIYRDTFNMKFMNLYTRIYSVVIKGNGKVKVPLGNTRCLYTHRLYSFEISSVETST